MARKEAPPLPKRVKMGPYTFRVTNDPRIMEAVAGTDGGRIAGFSTLEASTIGVRQDAARSHDYQADTLLHELLHCAFRVGGFQFASEDDEEKVVCAISPQLLHALRENPDVINFLTHRG